MAQGKPRNYGTLVLLALNLVCYGMIGWGFSMSPFEWGLIVPGFLLWTDLAMEAHYARIACRVTK